MNELALRTIESTHPEEIISRTTIQDAFIRASANLEMLAHSSSTLPLKHLGEAVQHALMQLQDAMWEIRTLHQAEIKKALHVKY
jgi:hypothetical protein